MINTVYLFIFFLWITRAFLFIRDCTAATLLYEAFFFGLPMWRLHFRVGASAADLRLESSQRRAPLYIAEPARRRRLGRRRACEPPLYIYRYIYQYERGGVKARRAWCAISCITLTLYIPAPSPSLYYGWLHIAVCYYSLSLSSTVVLNFCLV